jgi:putative FmdB family regulatory protein
LCWALSPCRSCCASGFFSILAPGQHWHGWAPGMESGLKRPPKPIIEGFASCGLLPGSPTRKSFRPMPIYAYKCESCGYAKDVLQKMSDAPLTDCPNCGAPAFKKQLTAAGFQLKGSGWYVTDFRGGQAAGAAEASAKGADAGGKPSDSSAPAAAPAAATPVASPAPAPATAAAKGSTPTKGDS